MTFTWNPLGNRFGTSLFVYASRFAAIPRTRSQTRRKLEGVCNDIAEAVADANATRETLETILSVVISARTGILSARSSTAPPGAFPDTEATQDDTGVPVDTSAHLSSSLTPLSTSSSTSQGLAPSISQNDLHTPSSISSVSSLTPSPPLSPPPAPLTFIPAHPPLAMAPVDWPMSYSRDAPHFTDDVIGFKTFFDAVDEWGRRAQASESDKMKWACRYAGIESESWETVPAYTDAAATFQQFRDQVRASYPHLDDNRRYTFNDLEVLIRRYQSYRDMTREEFGRYTRDFTTITKYLKTTQNLSDKEIGRRYLDGFPHIVRAHVLRRLEFTKQAIVPTDGYVFDDINETAAFIFSGGGSAYQAPELVPIPAQPASSDNTTMQEILKTMQSFAAALQHQRQPPPSLPAPVLYPQAPAPGVAVQNVPRYAPATYDTSAPQNCVFCSAPDHYIRDCPAVADYLQRGMITRNEAGKIVLPDGRFPPRTLPGKNMRDRVDRFWEAQGIQGKGPTVSTHFLETEENIIFPVDASLFKEAEENDDPEGATLEEQIKVLQAQLNSRKAKFDGVEIPKKNITASDGQQPPPAGPTIHSRPKNPAPNSRPQGPMKPITMPPKASDEHKHRYQAPVENAVKVSELVERTLDAKITVSARELLATSPEIRRQVKDLVTGKKVATNSLEVESADSYLSALHNDAPPRLDVSKYDPDASTTAPHSLPLRVIYPTFGPGVIPECILDGGAQVVVMRRDIWEQLRVPLAPHKAMKMESANSGTTLTLGMVQNLPVTLGDITIHLQIQVVDNAPFEVLLGRPFFAITRCTESNLAGGSHVIELIHPKTKEPSLFPTFERQKKTPVKPKAAVNFRQ